MMFLNELISKDLTHCSVLRSSSVGAASAAYVHYMMQLQLTKEGSQLVTICHRLNVNATDLEQRLTDVASAEILHHPSPPQKLR